MWARFLLWEAREFNLRILGKTNASNFIERISKHRDFYTEILNQQNRFVLLKKKTKLKRTKPTPHEKRFSLEKESSAVPPETFLPVLMGQGLFSEQALCSAYSCHVSTMNTTEVGSASIAVGVEADLAAWVTLWTPTCKAPGKDSILLPKPQLSSFVPFNVF